MKNAGDHPEFEFGDDPPKTDAFARGSDPRPSHEAAKRMAVTRLEAEVYETLKTHGGLMTCLCVSRKMNKPVWSISPRFKPLERKELIERAGTLVVLNSNGRPRKLTAWRVKNE